MKATVLDGIMEATIQTKKKKEGEEEKRLESAGGTEEPSLLCGYSWYKKEVSILRKSQVRRRFP